MTSVLLVSQHFTPEISANASRVSDVARVLVRHSREVSVLCPFPTLPFGRFLNGSAIREHSSVDGAEVHNIWSWRPLGSNPHVLSRLAFFGTFGLLAVLWCLLFGSKYSVVITSTPPLSTAFPGLVAKKILGVPWIVDYRDHWVAASVDIGLVRKRSLLAKIGTLLERTILSEADAVFVVHRSMVDVLAKVSGSSDTSRFVVLPNSVDTSLFRPGGRAKKRRLIFSGNIGLAYDFQNLIRAMPAIAKRHGVKLLILGDGNAREQVESFIQTSGLSWCASVRPPVSRADLPRIVSESLLGVSPGKELESLDCAIPMKVLEYMACGVPFVACGGSATRDLASESNAGLVVSNDVPPLVEAMSALLDDPDGMQRMGENGRGFISDNYETGKLGEVAVSAIEKLVRGTKASASALTSKTTPFHPIS
ncbi:MAG: glycosyltransferase family 4 protein [Candidatus Methylomirabilales bacterium]